MQVSFLNFKMASLVREMRWMRADAVLLHSSIVHSDRAAFLHSHLINCTNLTEKCTRFEVTATLSY